VFPCGSRRLCAVLLTVTAATAEPKAIVVLSSLHNLDYAEAACIQLRSMADIKDITEVLNNASDYDPEDVKFNKQLFDGIWECKSVRTRANWGGVSKTASSTSLL
jgi:hypothetical protein